MFLNNYVVVDLILGIVFIVSQYFSELYVDNLDRFLPFLVSNLRHKLLAAN